MVWGFDAPDANSSVLGNFNVDLSLTGSLRVEALSQ